MSHHTKRYWRSWDGRGTAAASDRHADQRADLEAASTSLMSRRSFLETAGFALFVSAVAGCTRSPAMKAVSPVRRPAGVIPGKARLYATVCQACPAGCGMLIKNRDGRPIKLEGNPEHPMSRGGLCAVGQASILELYDSHRLTTPLSAGQPCGWDDVDRQVHAALARVQSQGGAVRFLTGTISGPAERAMIDRFLGRFSDARHVVYDPLSSSAIRVAHERTHGASILPHYRLDRAEMVLAVDADFLGTWISPVEFAAEYGRRRVPETVSPEMLHHVQIESRLSLTGGKADRRLVILPEQVGLVMNHLAARIAQKAARPLDSQSLPEPPLPAHLLDQLADRLWKAGKKGLILCGCQDIDVQVLVNRIHEALGAYGTTVDVEQPSYQRLGQERPLARLADELRNGKVAALFIAGVNPVYDLPDGVALAESIARVGLTVSFCNHVDETAEQVQFVCPEGHPLERWSDAEPIAGVASIGQPAIRPLGNTRAVSASLAAWMGQPQSDYQIVRDYWKAKVHPLTSGNVPFPAFWDRALVNGFVTVGRDAVPLRPAVYTGVVPLPVAAVMPSTDRFTLVLYPKVGMLDGRHAMNPWLQELPDPISKATWDNYACLSPAAASRLGVHEGDVVRIAPQAADPGEGLLELPVLIQPGQHDQVVAVALGYGRKGTERFADIGPQWIQGRPSVGPNGLVGVRASHLLRFEDGTVRYERGDIAISRTGRHLLLACTQQHHEITVPEHLATPGAERREMIEETTLAEYRAHSTSGDHAAHTSEANLWTDDHPYLQHRWGMAIDLSRCTGCSACVIACQAENNVPVVGKDEVRRSREMHWIRIDRYYSESNGQVDVVHQPMMCHHCANAPCETVCPVLATAHSEEGLNQQVYNRCVGTRYCANNCPYKVRRFNWFQYARGDVLENVVLNPDVTVRSRGVMEKCSFCVQRIEEARIEAKKQGTPIADGVVQPACQQSCPARAIVFGDLNDPKSEVSKLVGGARAYQVLRELNIRPSVNYLRLVRNRDHA